MDNSISFKSKIQFVNYEKFRKILVLNGGKYIGYKSGSENVVIYPAFHTFNVRTCTAGGFVKPFRKIFSPSKKAMGFHILDNRENSETVVQKLKECLDFKPQGGLLVGGKKLYEKGGRISLYNFGVIKGFMSSVLPDFSFFRQQRYLYGETHMHYSLGEDTWTLCSKINGENNIKGRPNKCVSSVEDLIKHFKKIHIAKQDQLFVGDKQITPKDAPSFFA